MYAIWVHRRAGTTAYEDYPSEAEARLAFARYVSAAIMRGFAVERRAHTTKLERGDVQLTAWVAPVQDA